MLSEMDMEGIGTEEHVVGSCNNDATHITKGKRTKRRLRPLSPCAATTTATAVTSSCSSASAGEDYGSFSSTTFEGTDQEEEDMANCLILLAQGGGGGGGGGGEGDSHPHPNHHHQQQQLQKQEAENHVEGGVGNKMTESATKSGFYIYECKSCNRTFPSFQALGGHRASHKKPKVMMMMMMTTQEEKKSPPPPPRITTTCDEFEEAKQSSRSHMKISPNPNPNPPPVSLELGCGVNRGASFNKCSSKSSKIHECSICGSEFTSGQALGGHMRRHRATASTNNNNNTPPTIQTTFDAVVVDVNNKPRNVLELDLNLPAPEDDLRDSKFQFPTTQKSSMVLSPAPALVGCHY